MKIACTVGHSILKNGNITSASGVKHGGVNEYEWCKKFVPMLVEAINAQPGYSADKIQCPEKTFNAASEEKPYKLNIVNNKSYDLVIESHLNSFDTMAQGTETYYCTGSSKGKAYAEKINTQLSKIFTNRGAKANNKLYILSQTKPVSILIEYFFCDNSLDYNKAKSTSQMQDIALKVVEGIIGKTPVNPFTKTTVNSGDSNNSTYYRVVAGSFGDRKNADILVSELRAKGYNAFIDIYKK